MNVLHYHVCLPHRMECGRSHSEPFALFLFCRAFFNSAGAADVVRRRTSCPLRSLWFAFAIVSPGGLFVQSIVPRRLRYPCINKDLQATFTCSCSHVINFVISYRTLGVTSHAHIQLSLPSGLLSSAHGFQPFSSCRYSEKLRFHKEIL